MKRPFTPQASRAYFAADATSTPPEAASESLRSGQLQRPTKVGKRGFPGKLASGTLSPGDANSALLITAAEVGPDTRKFETLESSLISGINLVFTGPMWAAFSEDFGIGMYVRNSSTFNPDYTIDLVFESPPGPLEIQVLENSAIVQLGTATTYSQLVDAINADPILGELFYAGLITGVGAANTTVVPTSLVFGIVASGADKYLLAATNASGNVVIKADDFARAMSRDQSFDVKAVGTDPSQAYVPNDGGESVTLSGGEFGNGFTAVGHSISQIETELTLPGGGSHSQLTQTKFQRKLNRRNATNSGNDLIEKTSSITKAPGAKNRLTSLIN